MSRSAATFGLMATLHVAGGCATVSHHLRATPGQVSGDRLTVGAEVVRVSDFPIDIACGSRREHIERAYTIEYAWSVDGRLAPVRVTPAATGPQPEPPVADRGSRRVDVADLSDPRVVGPAPDPAWRSALDHAVGFARSLGFGDPATHVAGSALELTTDGKWVVVFAPAVRNGPATFDFASTSYPRDGCGHAVVFGRQVPDGRVFTGRQFAGTAAGAAWIEQVASVDGELVFLCGVFDADRFTVAWPFAGRVEALDGRHSFRADWNPDRRTLTLPLWSTSDDGHFGISIWSYGRHRCVDLTGDVRPLFHEADGTLEPGP